MGLCRGLQWDWHHQPRQKRLIAVQRFRQRTDVDEVFGAHRAELARCRLRRNALDLGGVSLRRTVLRG